jgi:hypothetical protein
MNETAPDSSSFSISTGLISGLMPINQNFDTYLAAYGIDD